MFWLAAPIKNPPREQRMWPMRTSAASRGPIGPIGRNPRKDGGDKDVTLRRPDPNIGVISQSCALS
jgi:hypothetical protein